LPQWGPRSRCGPLAESDYDKEVNLVTSNKPKLPWERADAWQPESEGCPLVARQLTRTMSGQPILDRADLAIGPGELVALVGANGAGKTTLLRCLAGRLRPTAGEVLWFGVSPKGRPDRHRLIGFAAHESLLYPELTAGENLLFAARMYDLPQPRERAGEMLAKTGLARLAGRTAGRLSQGLRQRLSLARALVHDPPIVLLDEPLAGLDTAGRAWLEGWLSELRDRDRAVVFSTHDDRGSRSLADRVLELHGGRLHATAESAVFPRARSA
jgi:heme ABC exporter ATP-binding subunit CcmA